ncbi:MAG: bifunctional metallophosphatase/5'-nucleotidase, partial [Persicimonas sp.]
MSTYRTFILVAFFAAICFAGCSSLTSGASGGDDEQVSKAAEPSDSEAAIRDDAQQVTVVYVADLHAQLDEHPELFWEDGRDRTETAGGFARVARAIDQIEEERDGEVLVLDAGDTIQGSGDAALTEGEAVVEPTNALGIDAGIPGNWSVAYGADVMKERFEQFDHEIFAANVHEEGSDDPLYDPYIIREIGGAKIAVIGYTDPDVPERQPPDYSKGLAYSDADQLPGLIDKVRDEEGADAVLL